ncbi:MAG: hypothetical protein WAQ57_02660 [Candidatus Saccharimonadales bacterium]
MAKTQTNSSIGYYLLRICRVHFLYIAVYALAIIIFDSWYLLSHEAVLQRWTLAGALLVVNTVIWYLCKLRFKNQNIYKILLVVLLAAGIIFAGVNVYWQRGMASKAVLLFTIPILSAALVRSRSLLLATASVSTAAYSTAAVRYFFDNYGQGLRVELYGEVAFYSAMFFVLAGLLMIGFRPAPD